MTDPQEGKGTNKSGSWVGVGAVLGVGIGAAVGTAIGNLGTGIWIGAVIGVGLGLLLMQIRR